MLILYLVCLVYACKAATRGLEGEGVMAGAPIGLFCGVYSMLVFSLTTYTLGYLLCRKDAQRRPQVIELPR